MKHEGKKWRTNASTSSYQNYANSAFVPCIPVFQYSNLSFPYLTYTLHILTYPTILCTLFTLSTCRVAEKISRRAEHRCIFFFSNFRVYQRLSVPGPKKRSINWSQKRSKRCSIVQGSSGPVHFYSMPRFH